ncbi:hypothetical protein LPA44_11080 [Halobacterium sp. KA-4]|uniref:hypothetical protein n=1 Tax=Halobacterium sp. KA-4 TaxID=2896367 RepID=UPI001E4FC28C|nr:hypothetical protein [Halobacterium sp. KA-4]MCD2200434.1 hypothetical protein [Halobacterium sp. KA-4]
MSLSIGSSLTDGVRRVANRNGLKLILGYVVLGLIWQVTFYSAFVTWIGTTDIPTDELGLPTVGAPFALLVVGAVLSLLALQYLTIVALRTFVNGHTQSIPREYFTRNIVYVLINSILGSVAFGLLVTLGTILLVIPGIIAYTAFLFMIVYITVEDQNFIAALRDSWTLTRGNWLRLFGLLLVLFVAVGIFASLLSVGTRIAITAIAGQSLGTLVSGIIALPVSLLTLGILAEAYTQLRNQTGTTEL